MSESNEVDEIVGEVRKFSVAMMAAMKRHTQAGNWLERRKARKDISRVVRAEQREQAQARTQDLTWTSQAVDRYRAHAHAVAARAADPRIDHDRRDRDGAGLMRHRDDLAGQFVSSSHLTPTEQGIALEGLDAVTVFPEYETGDLFGRAHKVRGLEALRYRARVAREKVGAKERATTEQAAWQANADSAERVSWESSVEAARRANQQRGELNRIEKAQPDQRRYRGQMSWTDNEGGVISESRFFPTEHAATEWIGRSIDHTLWTEGTTVQVDTFDSDSGATQYADRGRPEIVAERAAAREAVLREQTLPWQVHENQSAQARESEQEAPHFRSSVTYLPEGANQVQYERARHGSEIESAVWIHNQVSTIRPAADSRVLVSSWEYDAKGNTAPAFQAEGGPQFVVDEVTQWWDGAEHEHDRQRAEQPRESVAAERDQLRGELDSLTARHRLSIEHNGDLTDRNAELTRRMAALAAERDQLRGERDEAVRKVVERTPAGERFGSPQRRAEQARRSTRTESAEHVGPEQGRKRPKSEHEEAVQEWNELVGGNVARAEILQGLSESDIARRQLGEVEWTRFCNGTEDVNEVARQWVSGGAEKYWAERDAREGNAQTTTHTQPSEDRSALADYQPGRTLADAVAHNGHDREEMER